MISICYCLFFAGLLSLYSSTDTFSAYFVNWARYRQAPFTQVPNDLLPIIGKIDNIHYSFMYFCPPPGTNPMPYWAVSPYGNCTDSSAYQLLSVEPKDPDFLQQFVNMKQQNPKLKIILAIGGWNFPSAYFSKMAQKKETRSIFIQSVKQFLNQYNLDGVEIDWEYPCSQPRTNIVEISCWEFKYVNDAGGDCPVDSNNIVSLAREMKEQLAGKKIIVATQAAKENAAKMNVQGLSPFVDRFHVMNYDYTVSDITDPSGQITSPNAPLYSPSKPASPLSVNRTIQEYIKDFNVPPAKILLGFPLYGHSWFTPNNRNWNKFGQKGELQGKCCGVFSSTYGAKPGQGSKLCGSMMYSEILQANPSQTTFDNQTQSDIGYWNQSGSDNGYTEPGTWISYNGPQSADAFVKYSQQNKLHGIFVYDASMDGIENGQFTYPLMNRISDSLKANDMNTDDESQ